MTTVTTVAVVVVLAVIVVIAPVALEEAALDRDPLEPSRLPFPASFLLLPAPRPLALLEPLLDRLGRVEIAPLGRALVRSQAAVRGR